MKYVVLGCSAAGVNGAIELRKRDKDAEILLISKDEVPYSRCILHHYLCDMRTVEELNFVQPNFLEAFKIDTITGQACTHVDVEKQSITLSNESQISYDKLLIATGASTKFLDIPGLKDTKNVVGFRNLDDAEEIKTKCVQSKNIVILGAGLVGIDALSGLLELEKNVSVVEANTHLLSQQLDKRSSEPYQKAFENKGATFLFDTHVIEIKKNSLGNIEALILDNMTEIPCDLLILATGITANVDFLKNTTIALSDKGLIIDDHGKTNLENIFGAGDVTGLSPIWPVAVKEGIIAARNMTGGDSKLSDFFSSKATMNFEHIPTLSVGIQEAPDDQYQVEIRDEGKNYKKIIHKDGIIYGAIIQGDLSYSGILTQLIAAKIDISNIKKPLFDIDYSDFFHITDDLEFKYEGVNY